MLDYTTYVWMAQLFILGLVVGYMRDQIRDIRQESAEIQDNLNHQLGDIKDINNSNVRVKDVLEQQVVDQKEMMTGVLPSIRVLVSIVLPSWVSICTLGNCCADATPKVHRTAKIVRQKIFFIVQ